MPESGGVRHDFTRDQGLTPYTDRTLRLVAEDANGVAITSFAGWEADFFLVLETQRSVNGVANLQAAALFDRDEADAVPINLGTPPNVDVPIQVADWGAGAGQIPDAGARYWYEAWRTDAGNVERIAYGYLEVID